MAKRIATTSPWPVLGLQALIVVIALAATGIFGIHLEFHGLPPLLAVALGVAGGTATYGLMFWLTRFERLSPPSLRRHLRDLYAFANGYSWGVLIILSLLAGLGEELLFRGVIQGGIAGFSHEVVAVGVAAVLFGLVHCLSLAYFLVATLLGALLGAVYTLSDSIVLVIVWHSVYDLTVLVLLRKFPHLLEMDDDPS